MGRHNVVPPPRPQIIGRTYDEGLSPWPGRLFVTGVVLTAIAGVVAAGFILGRLLATTSVWMP